MTTSIKASAPGAHTHASALAAHATRIPASTPISPISPIAPQAAPKAPPPRKARTASECQTLEQLPNIGPAIAADLRLLGVLHPSQLAQLDAMQLYRQLCNSTGKRQDPCVLDTFMAATDFMRGAAPRPWWDYTALRKQEYGAL